MGKHVLIVGGSGLVGRKVAERLRTREGVSLINLLRTGRQEHSNDQALDFEALCLSPEETVKAIAPEGVEVAISCLGTTISSAGSKEAMRRVDLDYVVAFARGARAAGASRFILVSAAGAGGSGFYLKTKGEVEQAVTAMGFRRVDIMRPGLLLGKRNENRPVEGFAQLIFPYLNPLLVGSLARYGAISADVVAEAIVRVSVAEDAGVFLHHNRDISRLSLLSPPQS